MRRLINRFKGIFQVTYHKSADGDEDYLKRCLSFYKKFHIMAYGICLDEANIESEVIEYLEELHPDVLVVTGHDAYYKRKGDVKDIDNYKNTANFIKAVKNARCYEKSHEKLTIIATSVCLSDRNEKLDLINILEKTKYGSNGIGGVITNGAMYVGFPR